MELLGAFIGAWAEEIERRITLILVVTPMLTTSTSLALLTPSDHLAIWHLAAASFLNGRGCGTDNPVRRAQIGSSVVAYVACSECGLLWRRHTPERCDAKGAGLGGE
jgi:hypothetical protein